MRLLAGLLFVGAMLAVASVGEAQPPGGDKGDKGKFGGKGGPPQPGQIMPGFLQEVLKLSDEQRKQIAELQKDVDAKLDKILTDDQKKQLKEMRERGPGGFGRPGEKGPPPPGGDKGKVPPPGEKGDKKAPPVKD